jgi:hypothetical protein
MDDLKTQIIGDGTQAVVDEDAIENSEEIKNIVAKISGLGAGIDSALDNISKLKKERQEMTARTRDKFREAAEAIQSASVELNQAETEAGDELDKLTLQHAEDLADLDTAEEVI